MKGMKKMMLAGAVGLLFLCGGIVTLTSVYQQLISAIAGQQQRADITSDMLAGVPEWITLEMVSAAVEMMNETGYPASVVLGQMILEGGAGGSELSNPPYYNCLGQKSPSYGETGSVSMGTEEAWGHVTDSFSTFASYVDCMKAWGHKFTMAPYVDNVTACIRDPVTGYYDANAFIEAVWTSGYATDPDYVSKVIQIMTNYDLYKFNSMTADSLDFGGDRVMGSGRFTHPCPDMTYQSSYFGEIREFEANGHKGNDYAAPVGTPTYAADAGTVTIAGWSDSAGNWVVIDHGNGLVTKYMHHSRIVVSAGQSVRKGQKIGEVGSTGQSTGPHLHFQVEVNGVAVKPDDYM